MARKTPPDRPDATMQDSPGSAIQEGEAVPDSDKPCHFLELPVEVREMVYSYLMPTKETLISEDMRRDDKLLHTLFQEIVFTAAGEIKQRNPAKLYTANRASSTARTASPDRLPTTSYHPYIFALNKQISEEALVMLLRTNTYEFRFHGYSFRSRGEDEMYVLGPFDFHNQVDLIQNLRKVRLSAEIYSQTHWDAKRLRSRFPWCVDALTACQTDENGESLLRELSISFKPGLLHLRGYEFYATSFERQEKHFFCLESLSRLSCDKKVTIEGLPDWYGQCLKLAIEKKGGSLSPATWKPKWTKQREGFYTKRVKSSTENWWYPEYNWKEYAERNGITIPGHYKWLHDLM